MLLIPCPHCGLRNEDEFVYGVASTKKRPADPSAVSDAEWADFLYFHDNSKGRVRERWWHARGCQQWFMLDRDTLTHRIFGADTGESA